MNQLYARIVGARDKIPLILEIDGWLCLPISQIDKIKYKYMEDTSL